MDYIPQSKHWLVPENGAPCDIFLHFRGKFARGVAAKAPITFEFLEKVQKARCFFIYVRKADLALFENWKDERHSLDEKDSKKDTKKQPVGSKRAEYLSYIQKAMVLRDEENPKLSYAYKEGMQAVQAVTENPMLDWYFQQFHEPPDLFHHGARLVGSIAIFTALYPLLDVKTKENLLFSAVIHELQGDPKQSLNTIVSSTTIEMLEKNKRMVSEGVLSLIKKHDELQSGKGFPNNCKAADIPVAVKIFSLFNHYEHYRLKQNGTRRARHDATKKQLDLRKQDFEPRLWVIFWDFMERQLELVV